MGSRTVTQHEMDRRLAMAKAKGSITDAMLGHSLTAMEWANVLAESQQWMIGCGLREDWKEADEAGD